MRFFQWVGVLILTATYLFCNLVISSLFFERLHWFTFLPLVVPTLAYAYFTSKVWPKAKKKPTAAPDPRLANMSSRHG